MNFLGPDKEGGTLYGGRSLLVFMESIILDTGLKSKLVTKG